MLAEKHQHCPLCPDHARLWENGSYRRYLPGETAGDSVLGIIYRKRCSKCKVSFSLHPEFLLIRRQYSLTVVAAWLWSFLGGASVRCRQFTQHNAQLVPAMSGMSWSDVLDADRVLPGYQLLQRWSTAFCSKAEALLPELVSSAIEIGVTHVAQGRQVVKAAQALETAWLYWEAMWRMSSATATVDSEQAFRQLVRQLTRGASSHKARRMDPRASPYAVLIR
jgi:hypothetical protein